MEAISTFSRVLLLFVNPCGATVQRGKRYHRKTIRFWLSRLIPFTKSKLVSALCLSPVPLRSALPPNGYLLNLKYVKFSHVASALTLCTVKTNLRLGEYYPCLEFETKTKVVSIWVVFQDRHMFSHIIQKVSARAFH